MGRLRAEPSDRGGLGRQLSREVPIRPDPDVVLREPRLHLAVKAGVSAALAWLATLPLGGVADDYPYYAPFGAVVCASTTVASTLRTAGQAFATICLGAALAMAARVADLPAVVAIALVVACGTLLGAWRHLARMPGYVSVSGLFVLIVGGDDPLHYVWGYLGLTTLGGAVGVLVNGAFPSLPLAVTRRSEESLRRTLADQLDDLAEGLDQDRPPTARQWVRRQRPIEPYAREMQRVAAEVTDARRANWRAHRWSAAADEQHARSRALERLAHLVEDLTVLLTGTERADRCEVALGPELRPPTAQALRSTAELVRTAGGPGDREAWERAVAAARRLGEATIALRTRTDEELFAAGSVVTTLRRAHESLRGVVQDSPLG